MLIAQITDLHVRPPGKPAYRVSETNTMVVRAVDALAALRPQPDLVIVTGDMTDRGLQAEYDLLRSILQRLPMPVYMVPGNHDSRDAFRRAFPDHPAMEGKNGFVQYTVEDGPVRLIGLDTLALGRSDGELCVERLDFLEAALATDAGRPTIVFMHHPPFACGSGAMDSIRLLRGAERFAALISGAPQVERILCGHHHRAIQTRFAGTIASVAPGVAFQVELDLSPRESGELVLEPPAYQLHLYSPSIGLVSHTAYVERFPGPFPFVSGPD